MAQRTGLLNRSWEDTQIKVFGRWVQKHLKTKGIDFPDLTTGFENGVNLITLLEVIGKEPVAAKYHKTPKMRVQMLENVDSALKYIQEVKKIRLVGIGSNDIVDKNVKLTLGLSWSIINKFQIEDISVEEATARDALLIWSKKNTAGYEGVNVTNFTSSWSSSLAFCALINKFRPNLLDYNALNKEDHFDCCQKAFAACKELGIFVYLDPEDLVGITPDEKSVVTQVAEFFHFFASESKVGAMADKLKKTISIQKQIDELRSTYEEDARVAIEMMESEKSKLLASDYEKTVLGIKGKLVEVIKYGRVVRPEISERKSKALRSWVALVTKCKSTSRPIPVPPTGLEPETLTEKFNNVEETAVSRRKEVSEELKNKQAEMVESFVVSCASIEQNLDQISKDASLEGTLEERRDRLEELLVKAESTRPDVSSLDAPYQELVDLKLNTRSKYTNISISNITEQTITVIKRLIEQNKAELYQQGINIRIEEYNSKATQYVNEATEFEKEVLAITGHLSERRSSYIEKQSQLSSKRDGVDVLVPFFQDLEKDGLHLSIKNTPASIRAIYGNILSVITTELEKIFSEMISDYDKVALSILEMVKSISESASTLEGSPSEVHLLLQQKLEEIQEVYSQIPSLDSPFSELGEFKLNFRARFTPSDVLSDYNIAVSTLKHLIMSKEAEIAENQRNARIEDYNSKAIQIVNIAKSLETTVNSVEGELEQKRSRLSEIKIDIQKESPKVQELIPIYEELERDELHLEIEHTPVSINSLFTNTNTLVDTLVSEIDKAIASLKGIEISEEQLAEFRDTFNHFDKDHSQTLEYYELKACLTALGETSTDDECKEICKKYNNGSDSLVFDAYVKFMLDRFSKKETAETTLEAFKVVASNNPIITESQLSQYFSPEDVEYLKANMNPVDGGYDFNSWVSSLYA